MHGGDIYRNNIEIDFSVNINPLGMPPKAWEAVLGTQDEITKYPDINCENLRNIISQYHGVTPDRIVCGNGASEIIQGICYTAKAQKALLNAPSFSGYERALNNAGTRIYYNNLNAHEGFRLTKTFADKINAIQPKLIFLTNPNNPDGNLISRDVRMEILHMCRETGSILVADECFIEMTDTHENESFLTDASEDDNLIVIRAFTKSYGMPGIRLGYAICSDSYIADHLSEHMAEWSVSSIAQAVGVHVIGDQDYLENSRRCISTERGFLINELAGLGMTVYSSDANFILFEDTNSNGRNLYELMLKRGILIRDCSDYMGLKSGHYRVAVRLHEDNEKLIKALREV